MTKRERAIVYKACELLELGKNTYSCIALTAANNHNSYPLVPRYESFYDNDDDRSYWEWTSDPKQRQAEVIMALLWFAETESEI